MQKIIQEIEESQKRKDEMPEIKPGDSVDVHYGIYGTEKVQVYRGTVIRLANRGAARTFTVRRISYGVGVERVFPLHSPLLKKIVVTRKGKVRRAKLYYLRQRRGRDMRIKKTRD